MITGLRLPANSISPSTVAKDVTKPARNAASAEPSLCGAVVPMVKVADPPAVKVDGLKMQVVDVSAGGVQARDTVPAKPFKLFTATVTKPVDPLVKLSCTGVRVIE